MHFILLDLGFWKFLGFFKIDEVFVKFLGWVLFKWSSMLMHCITFSFSQCFMHFRCVFYMLKWCVLVGLDWAESIMFLMLHVTCSCIFHAYVPLFSIFLILIVFGAFLLLSLSLSLFLSIWLVYAWHLSASLLRPETLFVPGHLLFLCLLILPPLMFGSMKRRHVRTSWRTFQDATFI